MKSQVTSSRGTLLPMLRLVWPVLVEQLLIMLVGLVDTWLTGRYLEEQHLAAIGLMSYVLWLIPCTFGAVAVGATAMIARFVGAGQWDDARRVVNQAMVVGGLLAAVVTLATLLGRHFFVRLVQLPPDAAPFAAQYLLVLTPIVPAMMIEQVGIASLRGAGDTLSGFLVMALVNVVNIGVGAALVIGLGPFPQLGWWGLPIGTACGYLVGGLVLIFFLLRGRAGLWLAWPLLVPDLPLIRRFLRIGIPGGIDMVLIVCCHLWFLSIINRLGTVEAAAHGLGVRIESLAYLPGAAFQVAASTMTGQFLGARDLRRARRSALLACLVGGAVMCAAGVLMYFCGGWLAGLFLGDKTRQIADLTGPLLRVVAFAMPSLAVTMILTGSLRGAGDTRWPLVFTLVGIVGVRIPLAYWLAWDLVPLPLIGTLEGCNLGVIGAWYAMFLDLQVRGTLVAWRFLQGGWMRIRV